MFDRLFYLNALDFAAKTHEFQKRGNGDPYILHPIRVSTLVLSVEVPKDDFGLRDKLGVAGLLHDCIEDAEKNKRDVDFVRQEIESKFGKFVLDLVEELTQDASLPEAERRAAMVEHCGEMSRYAQMIKLADRLDNVSEMRNMSEKFIRRYLAETPVMMQKMEGACPELEKRLKLALEPYQEKFGAKV